MAKRITEDDIKDGLPGTGPSDEQGSGPLTDAQKLDSASGATGVDQRQKTLSDVEQEVLRKIAPNAAIPIITGGTAVGHHNALGPKILVEVLDACDPKSMGTFNLGLSSREGKWSWSERIPLARPVMLPERIVRHIEGLVERNRRMIGEDSAMYGDKAGAEAHNPGMRYVESNAGPMLVREFRRYIVRRVSPEEMRARSR